MLDENRFFRFVWRADAIIIFVAGALSVLTVIISLAVLVISSLGSRQAVEDRVVLDPVASPTQIQELGYLDEIEGTPHAMLPLYIGEEREYGFSSGSKSRDVANYLFINGINGNKRWLFDHNRYLVDNSNMVDDGDYPKRTVKAIVFTVIKADSDGDSHLGRKDKATLVVTAPDGSDHTEVLNDVDSVLGIHAMSKGRVIILYRKQAQAFSAELRLHPVIRLVSQTPLPKVGE